MILELIELELEIHSESPSDLMELQLEPELPQEIVFQMSLVIHIRLVLAYLSSEKKL
jgi:hypothetical protein